MNKSSFIFKNQPPYTFFNKSFVDPTDDLYLSLNEIDPQFLQNDESMTKLVLTESFDPRTKQPVKKLTYNYKSIHKPEIFKSPQRSVLTRPQHLALLQMLYTKQEHLNINDKTVVIPKHLADDYCKEKYYFQNFVKDYEERFKEQIYESSQRYVILYRAWYEKKLDELFESLTDTNYNTVLALPHVIKANCWEKDKEAAIHNCKLIARNGWVQIWNSANIHYKKLLHRIDVLSLVQPITHKLRIENELNLSLQLARKEDNCCYLSLESLVFIMTAGTYVDLPTEMLLSIEQNTSESNKLIRFDNPLPARNCGWHTHQLIVESAIENFKSKFRVSKWLKVDNDLVTMHKWDCYAEIEACKQFTDAYKLYTHDEYMEKLSSCHTERSKNNDALLQWSLQSPSDDLPKLNIITSLQLPPTLNDNATQFVGCHFIKLEHKPAFGCEVMTLYQLLKTWWQLKLLNLCAMADYSVCTHISIKDFECQVEECIFLNQLEECLDKLYHIKPNQLLPKLAMFLKMLTDMPPGQYMLRYNPKFTDKLILSAPSVETNQNTISLFSLLQTKPTDLNFMLGQYNLPISESICSHMHMYHKVLPCAFKPLLPGQKSQNKTYKLNDVNDRPIILQQVRESIQAERKIAVKRKHKRKREKQKIRKLLVKEKQIKAEEEEIELKKEMEIDKIFYGL